MIGVRPPAVSGSPAVGADDRSRASAPRGGAPADAAPRLVKLTLAAILLGATAVRLAYLVVLWASPLFLINGIRGLDMATYFSMAQSFAQARLPDPPTPFFQAPGYPLFLAAVMRLVPDATFAALTTVQVGLGVLACALLYELGRRLVSPAAGLIAAGLYAAYPLAWYYDGLLLSENLLVVLVLGLALAAMWALESPTDWRAWLVTACVCGLATLVRANLAVVLPVLVGASWLLRHKRPRATCNSRSGAMASSMWRGPDSRSHIAAVCVGVAAFTIVILPAAVYNSLAAGTLQFTSTQGNHLWLSGNTAFATGVYQLPCGPALLPTSADFWMLQGRKVLLFFSNEEFGNNAYIGVFRAHLGTLALPLIGFGWLVAIGLLGWMSAPLRSRRWLAFSIVLALYVGTIALFAIVGRYRLPAAALLCVPGAAVLVRLPDLRRARPHLLRARSLRMVLAAVVVTVVMVGANVDLPYDVSVPFGHANAATVYAEAGDQATAQQESALAHASRLSVEANDPHACSQLPDF